MNGMLLTSHNENNHDELDFEFLVNREGKPIMLQTNVFTNGQGNRKYKINLWFDPTAEFRTDKILWDIYRIFCGWCSYKIAQEQNRCRSWLPIVAANASTGTLWNGESWATDGGQTKTNWSYAPFKANFQGFDIDGCSVQGSDIQPCFSTDHWWNGEKYWNLDLPNKRHMRMCKGIIIYDYCSDTNKSPTPPSECPN